MYSKKLGKWGIILVVSLILSLLSVSCGKTPQQTSQQQTSFAPEDYIIRTTEDWPTYIDPAVGNDFSDSIALVNLYDTLVFPTLQGDIKPWLAESWDISPDHLTYTFHLRHGVKFHNGDELTAKDVEFSMKRLLTIGEGFAYIYSPYVKDCKATDKYTVVFTLKKPFGPFIESLVRFYILNERQVMEHIEKPGQYGDMGDYGKKWLLTNDAGSGPYKVKEMKMEEYLLAEKFDDWWGGWDPDAPKFFKESATSEPTTEYTLVAKRELEITDELLPLETYNAMAKINGVSVVTFLNGNNFNIMLNTKKPPTDDIHFRKALAYCFDYDQVISSIYPGAVQSKGPVPATIPGHDPNVFQYHRDLNKAKAELALSKYANKLDQYPVTLSWCAEAPEEEKVALLFQSNAAELGIKVQITKKPFGEMEADAQSVQTTPNASLIFVATHYPEAGAMLATRYHSSSCGTWEQCEWLQNPEIDKMIEDALSTVDREERFKKYYAIQEKIVDLCPTIWVFDQAERRAYQSAYIYWPVGEAAQAHKAITPVMGYGEYAHDMKVWPEKRAALLKP
jgi:peptide/nickel transport system substrate-binding protein